MVQGLLKKNKLKTTKKREVILKLLQSSEKPMSAEDLYKYSKNEVNINLSTIYRTLAILSNRNILIKHIRLDGVTDYRINNNTHIHHLVCSLCNTSVDIDCCPLEELGVQLSESTGYLITEHNLEFSGVCPNCAKESTCVKV